MGSPYSAAVARSFENGGHIINGSVASARNGALVKGPEVRHVERVP